MWFFQCLLYDLNLGFYYKGNSSKNTPELTCAHFEKSGCIKIENGDYPEFSKTT